MTFPELNNKLENIVRDIIAERGQMMVDLGVSALMMIKKRVQETGVDAKGSKYRPYSTKAMLIGAKSARTKEVEDLLFGSKKKRAAMDWVTLGGKYNALGSYLETSAGGTGPSNVVRLAVLKGGYKKLRSLWGLPTDRVTFSVTNDMWNDINIVSNSGQHQQGVVVLGAKQDIEKKKLAGNTKSRGDILDLNPTEIHKLYKQCELTSLQVIRNNGL